MGDVIGFPKRELAGASEPHLEGPARCLRCKHEWRAVTPAGVFEGMECPACGTCHGARLGTIGPDDGVIWVCSCGNNLFHLTPTGAPLCPLCGLRATDWAEG